MANQSLEACEHLSYSAWQSRYLTHHGIHNNLVAAICINSVSAIIAMLLNALVIIIQTTKQHLRTLYNILLASLAGTDFLVGMLVQPLFVAAEIKHILGLGWFCMFDTVIGMIGMGVNLASIGHLVLIGVERYIFIKLPRRYDDIVTEKRVIAGVLAAWAVSTVGIVVLIFLTSINTESDFYSMLLVVTDLILVFVLVVFIAAIVFTQTAVFLEAKKQKRRLQTEQLPDEEVKRLKKNKAANTLTITLTALLFSYMPVLALYGSATFSDDLVEPQVWYVLLTWSYTTVYFCSLLNPLIYCWRMKRLRGELLEILHLRRAQVCADMEWLLQQIIQPIRRNEAWAAAASGLELSVERA